MKRTIGMLMMCTAALWAEDTPERATVPLHDPAHPPVIHVHMMNGGVVVQGADRADVLVEARTRADEESHGRHAAARADGMLFTVSPNSPISNRGHEVIQDLIDLDAPVMGLIG